jgi:hypothetical protein
MITSHSSFHDIYRAFTHNIDVSFLSLRRIKTGEGKKNEEQRVSKEK